MEVCEVTPRVGENIISMTPEHLLGVIGMSGALGALVLAVLVGSILGGRR